jgi:transglutaminase-like putative cysteine protease
MYDSWEVLSIPAGLPGTAATLSKMADLVRAAQLAPVTRSTALQLLERRRPRSTAAGCADLNRWVGHHMAWINEPNETLVRPEWMLEEIAAGRKPWGDCDDAAMLVSSLNMARGLPVRMRAVYDPENPEFAHVFGEVQADGYWLISDPSAPGVVPPFGWASMIVNV